jgi:hypothetical protein
MTTRLAASPREDLEAAVHSDEPIQGLRAVAKKLLASGTSREAVYSISDGYREALESQNRNDEADLVLEVMTHLDGWASSHLRL